MKYCLVFTNVESWLAGFATDTTPIENALRLADSDLRSELASYLAAGYPLTQVLGYGTDHFGSGEQTPLNVMTDGVWAWPEDAAFYVAKYGVSPPQEFIDHVGAQDGQIPVLTDGDRDRALAEFKSDADAVRASTQLGQAPN